MDRFRSGKSLSPIRQAEAYWSALCVDGDVPFRTRIDPRALENILHHAFILEHIAPGIARFRLAGAHLNDLAGMEVRGMPLSACFIPAARPAITTVLSRVFDAPAVAELTLVSDPSGRRPRTEARMILLPLKDDAGNVTRALGTLVAEDTPGPRPIRFDLTGQTLRPVATTRAVTAKSTRPQPGFAEPRTPFTPRPPYLKVVK